MLTIILVLWTGIVFAQDVDLDVVDLESGAVEEIERLQLEQADSAIFRAGKFKGDLLYRPGNRTFYRAVLGYGPVRAGFSKGAFVEYRKGFLYAVAGDFNIRSGYGLTLWTGGLRLSGQRDPLAGVFSEGSGVRAYSGRVPENALRGLALSIMPVNELRLSGFASRQHREELFGITADFTKGPVRSGMTLVSGRYDTLAFRRGGVYARILVGGIIPFGEIDLPSTRSLVGVRVPALDLGDVVLAFRNYPATESLDRTAATLARTTPDHGEHGFYAGVRLHPRQGLTVYGWADQYTVQRVSSRIDYSSSGQAYSLALEQRFRSWLTWSVQLRTGADEYLSSAGPISQPVVRERHRLRLDLRYDFSTALRSVSRLEAVRYEDDRDRSSGIMFFQEALFQPSKKVFLAARYGAFDTDGYDARFAPVERDVSLSYSAPALYGNGTSAYLLLDVHPWAGLNLQARYARTLRYGGDFSLTPQQSVRDDVRIQARYTW